MKLNEAILSEKQSAAAEYKKRKSAVAKELKEIEKKIKGMDARQKKDPENWGYPGSLGNVEKNLKELSAELGGAANETAVRDSSGAGEVKNQRGTRSHARGKAHEGEKWLKANPRNEW